MLYARRWNQENLEDVFLIRKKLSKDYSPYDALD